MSRLVMLSFVRMSGTEKGSRFLSTSLTRWHNPSEEEKSCSKAESQAEMLRYRSYLYKMN
jgi:hypothetical protein